MFTDIDRALADLRDAIGGPGQACHIEIDMAELIQREFSLEARIARAVRLHLRVRHLRRFKLAA